MNVSQRIKDLDREIGLKIGDYPLGPFMRTQGLAKIKLARALSSQSRDSETVEEIEHRGKKLSGKFSEDLVDSLVDYSRSYLGSEASGVKKIGDKEVWKAINDEVVDFQEVEGFERFKDDPEVLEMARSYFGSEIEFGFSMVIQYRSLPAESESTDPSNTLTWHIDHADQNALRLLVFLTDEEGGAPLKLVSEEDTRELLDEFGYRQIQQNPEIVEEEAEVREVEGGKGTAVVFDPVKQLHRASSPVEGEERMVCVFSIMPDISL